MDIFKRLCYFSITVLSLAVLSTAYSSTEVPRTLTYFGDSLSDTHRQLDTIPGVNNNWFVAQSGLQDFPVSSLSRASNDALQIGTWANFVVESNNEFIHDILPWRIAQLIGNVNVIEHNNNYAFISALSGDNFTNDSNPENPGTIDPNCIMPGQLSSVSSCVPGYIKQVRMYLTDLGGQSIPNNAVYISWIGANDLLAALQSLLPKIGQPSNNKTLITQHAFDSLNQTDRDKTNYLQILINSGVSVDDLRWQAATKELMHNFTIESEITIEQIVDNITIGLQDLLANGADPSQLYVFGTPALEDAPIAIRTIEEAGPLGPFIQQVIEQVTIEFNDLLSESIKDMGIHFFSTNDVLQEVLANPTKHRFDPNKVTTSCVTDNNASAFPECIASFDQSGPLFYMYTDDTGHPTYQLHAILGANINNSL